MRRSWWSAVPFVLVCQLAGALGALTTETGTSGWYGDLAKPAFQPPGWVFGPVWTLLYALMGVAAWRIWRLGTTDPGVRRALALFGLQLALNAAWTPIFFGAHRVGWALVVLAALWLALLATLLAFRPLDRWASWLLAPYLAWVSFAVVLNAAILDLNGAHP
jgi:tryptophan-rich sensory protein